MFFKHNEELKSFRLVVKPGDRKLRSGDYMTILVLCAIGSFVLILIVGSAI